ncbi:UDP-glucose--hexose-1-phosphate uridylyltransferase [Chryseobacterium hagamense]|uniref:Galactose-1-phosphate uridylyltransferase n=1 Tax=Chryseobacterium hagamense TaxID=395935 RepID=A0A511YGI9_9FLAO|nr:UDP-glucose--hexose-1-phosphate uridylyltransferase [Chryseobacterium hagamense]GEN74276.1 galactose-1-phosphate uridylyltransferase [Chryseobacterium hagamense]
MNTVEMNTSFNQKQHPHRRYNPLLDEWILVSPQRANRPWQGQTEEKTEESLPAHDENCYLCPGNVRVNGERNPEYKGVYVFNNDFGSLMKEEVDASVESSGFFTLQPERGINRVICFSDNHSLTLPEMEPDAIKNVVEVWQRQYEELGSLDYINHVQIFENKGQMMGCSNPHPHGQIWAQSSIPSIISKTQENLKKYFEKNGTSLLEDYVKKELEAGERIILENEDFVAVVPFWAVWPYETMIVSKRKIENILHFSEAGKVSLASMIKDLTTKYDNLFEISFPYSAGIHQSPTDGKPHPEWHFHMHFYPPLLRNAEVKKFMVGYEMLAEPQRDITPEQSAGVLKSLPVVHYKSK